jgi:murein DD-endopeptidase MepM/ murein hydrolase activator NlpD
MSEFNISDYFYLMLSFDKSEHIFVIDSSISKSAYCSLDLSAGNEELKVIDLSSSKELGVYVNKVIAKNNAEIAYGGYLEKRNIYQRSEYFKSETNPKDERNIHLGIDFWAEAGTSVLAALDGSVHSFQNNTNHGDYGPTIILEHDIDGNKFYTLYGHLSLESIQNISIGQVVEQGDEIAELGSAKVNGDYPPHLHFQIIYDLKGMSGDYPGVCSENEIDFYKENSPDPSLLLNL